MTAVMFDRVADEILTREDRTRKFSIHNIAGDKGGATRGGITLMSLSEFLKRPATLTDLARMSIEDMREFYIRQYMILPHFSDIQDEQLAELMIDSGVLHGRARSTMWLQSALGVVQDGNFGPRTRAALGAVAPRPVYLAVLDSRYKGFAAYVASDHTQIKFLEGWQERAGEFLLKA